MNYFELFEIPISLKVDKNILQKKYFELFKKYHPDFYTHASEDEKNQALEISSQLNKAKAVFSDTDETIKYVLLIKGLLTENEKYNLPQDFLMQMMELNETLDENNHDAAKKIIQEQSMELFQSIEPIIINFNASNTSSAQWQKLKDYYFKRKYLLRLAERIQE